MRHSDWSYVLIAAIVLAGSFAVVLVQLGRGAPMPTEPWLAITGILGHWFGRTNGGGKGNGNGG